MRRTPPTVLGPRTGSATGRKRVDTGTTGEGFAIALAKSGQKRCASPRGLDRRRKRKTRGSGAGAAPVARFATGVALAREDGVLESAPVAASAGAQRRGATDSGVRRRRSVAARSRRSSSPRRVRGGRKAAQPRAIHKAAVPIATTIAPTRRRCRSGNISSCSTACFQPRGATNRNRPSNTATRHKARTTSPATSPQRSDLRYCRNGSSRSSTITLWPSAKDLR